GRACNVAEDIGSNSTSQSTIRNGSFLQLLYGGSLRIASEYCGRSSHDRDRNNREMASKQTTVEVAPPTAEGERPMRADARRNYQRLLEAGRQVLTERGSEASMEEIARRADVGVGTLYRHFPRRIDLVEAVYREDVDGLVELARTVNQNADPWQGLVDWLIGFVKYGQSKRVFLTELHEAFEKNPDLVLSLREKIAGAVSTVLVRAQ